MKSRLLVVTTFYNEKERLKLTLENMSKQKSTDFVHLIIDDGSKDNSADEIVSEYIKKSKHSVVFEKHENAGINMVHMLAFKRTKEFGCTHFMWLDCGDGLTENAMDSINKIIQKTPELWLHLNGYYISEQGKKKTKMSSRSYLPYLQKKDQFIPFCFSISTYGHFIIPFDVYEKLNPEFHLVEGFYYDAQIVGALSLNHEPQLFINSPLSIIEDDCHFSVTNSTSGNYRENLIKLADFALNTQEEKERVANISFGIYKISVRKLIGRHYSKNRSNIKELKQFYRANGIRFCDWYKRGAVLILSWIHLC